MTTSGRFRAAPFLVVFDGQSLNLQPAAPNRYPDVVMAGRNIPSKIVAIGGFSWLQLATTVDIESAGFSCQAFAKRVAPYSRAALKSIYHMIGGTTDVEFYATGQECYDHERDIADMARAAGFDYVINSTTTPSDNFDGAEEAVRAAANTLIVANADLAFDAVIDFRADAFLEDETNATYYVDGTHWTAAGAALAVTYGAPVLDAAIAALA